MKVFAGKKAFVLGGSGGIGAHLSLLLAQHGAQVAVHGGHESEKYTALIKKVTAYSPDSRAFVYALSSDSFSHIASSPIAEAARDCDILCVCYGPFLQKPLHAMSAESWQTMALLDFALPGFLISTALPAMMQKKWGRILLFGGTGTLVRSEFLTNAAYAGAKAGVATLVQSTAAAYASDGITCNAVLPGFTQTEYTEHAALLAQKMPRGTLISAASVAESAFFLLKNSDINGALLRVDGGWSPSAQKQA